MLVWQDAFGLRTGRMAKFVKQYADVHGVLLDAARAYAEDVRAGTFPGPSTRSRPVQPGDVSWTSYGGSTRRLRPYDENRGERGTTVLLVSQRRAAVDRFGVLFPSLWLFLLLDPLLEGWARREETRGVLGLVCTVAFAAVYLSLWLCSPEERRRLVRDSPLRWSVGYVGALAALGALCVLLLGEPGIICVVYVSGACVMAFPLRVSAPVVVALGAGTLALGARADWGSQLVTAFGVMAASSAVYGLRAVLIRDRDLVRAHEENARLAVDNERSRFARDLHDILGHSLTVVTVKAELAQKLLDVDVERARAEVADLERLSRDALVDVRRAVEGYREITLPGELVRARVALRAAEIEADLPTTTDDIPSELRGCSPGPSGRGHQRDPALRCPALHGPAHRHRRRDQRRRTRRALPQRARLGAGRTARARRRGGRHRGHPGALPRLLAERGAVVTIRLLLADDQAMVRSALSALLGLQPDFEVVAEVGSGDAVLPAVLEHHPDVALLDVEMPGLDGISAAAEVRRPPRRPGS